MVRPVYHIPFFLSHRFAVEIVIELRLMRCYAIHKFNFSMVGIQLRAEIVFRPFLFVLSLRPI